MITHQIQFSTITNTITTVIEWIGNPVRRSLRVSFAIFLIWHAASASNGQGDIAAPLPSGVKAVWDVAKAHHETTASRERICINGLWRWQPALADTGRAPVKDWGYFKVPGSWPGATDYMQKDSQSVFAHPSWKNQRLANISAAWYEREISVPPEWASRRIALSVEYLNSFATVFVDGVKRGEARFPAGDVDLTEYCRPGATCRLSLLVEAMPLKGVLLSYTDSNSAREIKGKVDRRGLCGDVFLVATPVGPRIADVRVNTSVRQWEIKCETSLRGLTSDARYFLRARITKDGGVVKEFTGRSFTGNDAEDGRIAFTEKWRPDALWDLHTPQNSCEATLTLLDSEGRALDTSFPARFGFREFWIEGRDFFLNGTRLGLCAVPLDNAQVGAALANYDSARESLERLKGFGINCVYTHNYGCQPGSHLSFTEILRAADDVGMLIALSQPHFSHYEWKTAEADRTNGYARHAEFYARVAENHPSVIAYAMSHNATGYNEDMNPDLIDGLHDPRDTGSKNNAQLALRAEATVRRLDPGRIVYHHASGNLGSMHTSNFYPNFAPIQELSDWFEHWATHGVKPLFTCEYGAPFTWDWTMYRGWYKGQREFGSANVPWEFCLAEWNAQFLGDRAFQISEKEAANLRWEAKQLQAGKVWHRWDYPHAVGSPVFDECYPIFARYLADNWPAFRTWGVSAISPWEYGHFWKLREGVEKRRKELTVDWEKLQRPGFSPDFVDQQYERMDLAFDRTDWIPTAAAQALLRFNQPLLAYIAGKPERFTSKDHLFAPGETVEKQIVVINNSRQTVNWECEWSFGLPKAETGRTTFALPTGEQKRVPLQFKLPETLKPGEYELKARVRFGNGNTGSSRTTGRLTPSLPSDGGEGRGEEVRSSRSLTPLLGPLPTPASRGEERNANAKDSFAADKPSTLATQTDSFLIRVLPRPPDVQTSGRIALFDPKGETGGLLKGMGVRWQPVEADADLSSFETLIVGKSALTVESPGPDIARVRDGLKVIVFEQAPDVLEKRLGFRVAEYGLRQVFARVPDHPLLAGIAVEDLRDWRGEPTILPPRLTYGLRPRHGPTVQWCDIPVPRIWRCGNRGNVASVLIEKPALGNFLPIIDGGYSLQYSPLLEYRQGRGLILFCQMDVTGRTENDPAAETLTQNIFRYVSDWKPAPARKGVYVGDPAGKRYLESAGIDSESFPSEKLSPGQVLILGPGAGRKLGANKAAIAEWLRSGGNLVAIGIDQQDADTVLPSRVTFRMAEHIASFFEPNGLDSPFRGIGPADVHNRDPRQLPLIASGATVIGDGVLARAKDANVVFCQLAPWQFDSGKQPNLKRTSRRVSFAVTRLLANLGVSGSAPLVERFKTPLDSAEPEKRWLTGLYLDQPEEWDDPYRFFRW